MTRRELLTACAAPFTFSFLTGEARTMDQRITLVTLGVKNLAAAREFYVQGLGWKPAQENNEIVFFQAGGMVFALFLRDKLAEEIRLPTGSSGRSAFAFAYNVREKKEVDPLLKRAADAGATILTPAREASWGGYSGYFADLDGFAWEIAWNPGWTLKPDGSVSLS